MKKKKIYIEICIFFIAIIAIILSASYNTNFLNIKEIIHTQLKASSEEDDDDFDDFENDFNEDDWDYDEDTYNDETLKGNVNTVKKVTLNYTNIQIDVGQQFTTLKATPDVTTDILWTSSKSDVAIVDSKGIITPQKSGTTQIIATAKDNKTVYAVCNVTVSQPVTSLEITPKTIEIEKGNTEQLNSKVTPNNATNTTVTSWTSSNTEIVTVNNTGKITAKSVGTATITATIKKSPNLNDEIKATCTIRVKEKSIAVQKIELDNSNIEIQKGLAKTINITEITPDNATDKGIEWKSDDTNIAIVNEGQIHGINIGKTTIRAISHSNGEVQAECEVEVKEKVIDATKIEIDKGDFSIQKGQKETLIANITPANSTSTITWKSDNPEILSINEETGEIEALESGKTKITVKTNSGIENSIYVSVITVINDLKFNIEDNDNIVLNKAETYNFKNILTIDPPEMQTKVTYKWEAIKWSNQYSSIYEDIPFIIVDDTGCGRALNVGGSTIRVTAETENGEKKSAEVDVWVTDQEIKVNNINLKLDTEDAKIEVGEKKEILYDINPITATNCNLDWTSDNEEVLMVNQNGYVTANKPGEATITAKATDGSNVEGTINIKVVGTYIECPKKLIEEDEEIDLKAIVDWGEDVTPELTWSTDDEEEEIISIQNSNESQATIKGISEGTAKIYLTAKVEDKEKTVEIEINVTQEITIEEIELLYNKATLIAGSGDKYPIIPLIKIQPDNATNRRISFTCSNENIATIDDKGNIVPGEETGEATITVASEDGNCSAEFSVYVVNDCSYVSNVNIYESRIELVVNKIQQIRTSKDLNDVNNNDIIWISDNPNIAEINSTSGNSRYEFANIKGITPGKTKIRAIAVDKNIVFDECEVIVGENITGFNLENDEITLRENEIGRIIPKVEPENAIKPTFYYNIEDNNNSFGYSDVVQIDSDTGVIIPVGVGSINVIVYTEYGEYSRECKINVIKSDYSVQSVKIDQESIEMEKGESTDLHAIIYPGYAENQNVIWKSDNEDIVSVNENGQITANSGGKAIITVKTEDGEKEASCIVKVNSPVTGITIEPTEKDMFVGDTNKLNVVLEPEDTTETNITWTSDNENIIGVDEVGNVFANDVGTAVISATTENGEYTAECTITVYERTFKVTSVEIEPKEISLDIDETAQLTAKIYPEYAINKNVTWESDNSEIVEINEDGRIKAKSTGTAIITVITEDGEFESTTFVVVKEPKAEIERIEIQEKETEMKVNEVTYLLAKKYPENTEDIKLIWKSSDENIASIESLRKEDNESLKLSSEEIEKNKNYIAMVKAIKEGKTTITVSTEDEKFMDSFVLNVTKENITNEEEDKPRDDEDGWNDNELDDGEQQEKNKSDSEEKIKESNGKKPDYPQDTSIANKILPKTGIQRFILASIAFIIGISIYRYKKYKNI